MIVNDEGGFFSVSVSAFDVNGDYYNDYRKYSGGSEAIFALAKGGNTHYLLRKDKFAKGDIHYSLNVMYSNIWFMTDRCEKM
ncbi:hypothetical protein STW0522ENT62_14270 [Enterobacter kobei]|uniref:hypothetical protein n=1 Tax=Enterobacter kobei TaxID=208224 RepID=UPI0018A4B2AC|nr:hypothetical protein [Enterobacter kobei]BBV85981.1 hypothetical protein STW0522ENT62_14270 [Enterobacter kobei]